MNKTEMTIVTKLGTFNVVPKDKIGSYIYKNGVLVCTANNIPYWNKDELVKALETHKELVLEKTKNEMAFITKDNVKAALERVAEVLGKDEKGFYASRLKQCIFHLTSTYKWRNTT